MASIVSLALVACSQAAIAEIPAHIATASANNAVPFENQLAFSARSSTGGSGRPAIALNLSSHPGKKKIQSLYCRAYFHLCYATRLLRAGPVSFVGVRLLAVVGDLLLLTDVWRVVLERQTKAEPDGAP